MDATSIPNRELYGESLRCLNNLAQYRRDENFCRQQYRATGHLVGVACWRRVRSLLHVFLWNEKHYKTQYLITTTLTVTVTSILFLVYVLDHPFTGTSRVSLAPLREAMAAMQGDSAGE